MQTLLALVVETAVDKMPRGLVGMRAEKVTRVMVCPFMEISDRDPLPKWDFQEPGARLRPWLRELSFWATRHQYSCEQTRVSNCTRHCPSERLVGVWQINFQRIKSVRVKVLI